MYNSCFYWSLSGVQTYRPLTCKKMLSFEAALAITHSFFLKATFGLFRKCIHQHVYIDLLSKQFYPNWTYDLCRSMPIQGTNATNDKAYLKSFARKSEVDLKGLPHQFPLPQVCTPSPYSIWGWENDLSGPKYNVFQITSSFQGRLQKISEDSEIVYQ